MHDELNWRPTPAMRRNALIGTGLSLAGAAILLVLATLANLGQQRGLGSWAAAGFLGVYLAMMYVIALGVAFVGIFYPAQARGRPVEAKDPALAAALRAAEAARQAVLAGVYRRASWGLPIGAMAGLGFWACLFFFDKTHRPGMLELGGYPLLGLALAYVLVTRGQRPRYRRLYKSYVMPVVAAQLGDVTWRLAPRPDPAELRRRGFFPAFDDAWAEDEITGRRHGLDIRLTVLTLTKRSGRSLSIIFEGVLVEVALKNRLVGETMIVPDAGPFGNLRERLTADGMQRVRLEDPVFERVFEVYGADQVMARALLQPDFMERMLALADEPGFGHPAAIVRDSRLLLALPRPGAGALFTAPDYNHPANAEGVLAAMRRDLTSALVCADVAMALDAATARAAQRFSGGEGRDGSFA